MAGLVPAIHVFLITRPKDVDARHTGVRKHAVLRTAMAGHDVLINDVRLTQLSSGPHAVGVIGMILIIVVVLMLPGRI